MLRPCDSLRKKLHADTCNRRPLLELNVARPPSEAPHVPHMIVLTYIEWGMFDVAGVVWRMAYVVEREENCTEKCRLLAFHRTSYKTAPYLDLHVRCCIMYFLLSCMQCKELMLCMRKIVHPYIWKNSEGTFSDNWLDCPFYTVLSALTPTSFLILAGNNTSIVVIFNVIW